MTSYGFYFIFPNLIALVISPFHWLTSATRKSCQTLGIITSTKFVLLRISITGEGIQPGSSVPLCYAPAIITRALELRLQMVRTLRSSVWIHIVYRFTCYFIRVKYPAQNWVRNEVITGKLLRTFLATVMNIINFQNPRVAFLFVCFWHDSPPVGQGLLIHEVSRSHTTTQHSR